VNFREIQRVLWLVLGLNVIVATSKIVLGALTGTISILSDGVHSGFDTITNIVGLIGIKIAEKPADEDHPYGHRKYEAIASQIIFTFLVIAGWKIGEDSFEKIFNPALIHVSIPWFTFAVLACCMIIDAFVAWYEGRKGEKLKSMILTADSIHTKTHYNRCSALGRNLDKNRFAVNC
jgi:cation diffusion facilitator family transporter